MRFTKMHGIGNDYVYVNCFEEQVSQPEKLAPVISDRHFGVGGDGLILITPSDKADVRMRMFNADGSEAQMCGNGVRCVAKYAFDHGLTAGRPVDDEQHICCDMLDGIAPASGAEIVQISVETGRGVLQLILAVRDGKVQVVCVDMGEPILLPSDIPVDVIGQQAVGVPLSVCGENFLMACVSMGNPHAVIYCNDVQGVDLEKFGPAIENHPLFPERVNVHFVQRLSDNEVIMRTWERGSGITLACGTGAAAVCVAGVLASKTDHTITAHLPGGDLVLRWDNNDNHVYMAGTATEVFSGEWPATLPNG